MAENTISPRLQKRIQDLMESESGKRSRMNMNVAPENFTAPLLPERMNMNVAPESMNTDADPSLRVFIEDLANQISQTDDPDEQQILNKVVEKLDLNQKAPLADIAQSVQQAGTGEDTVLAHLSPGEIVLPAQFMEDEQLESMIEAKFTESGIDPREAVAGIGIASLNQMTGLEEFGFFKKLGKSLKKVAKFVAPAAMLIPGVGTAVGAALGGIGGLAGSALGKIGLGGVAKGIGSAASSALKGIAGLKIPGISSIAGGASAGSFSAPFAGLQGLSGSEVLKGLLAGGPFGAEGSQFYQGAQTGLTPVQQAIEKMRESGTFDLKEQEAFGSAALKKVSQIYSTPEDSNGIVSRIGEYILPGTDGKSLLSNLAGSLTGGDGGIGSLSKLGLAGAAAAKLGQLAMDEARKDKGVPLTPLTTMDAGGRYNIEAEIARRMGLPAPNPVEFGLQPRFPTLSGAQEGPRQEAVISPYVQQAAMGGAIYPLAYAEGGDVAMEDYERMNGDIDGPGTETSDDIPAMLSDGEFVMTGQAVRGAGSFELNEEPNGILTLVPSASESREKGTQLMYQMMDVFGRYADATN